jgi:hypothetical protein
MIIQGGRAGSVSFWSTHLLRMDTNTRAEITELRGVVADDLKGALREMQAVASGSRCDDNFMYQANINPRGHEKLTPAQWAQAVDTLERNLGFEGHARVVVEHEKEGRQHVHVIWSRVDENLRVVSPFNNYWTHQRTARDLEREFGLEQVPQRRVGERPIQLWEQEKAEKTKIDPKAMKVELTGLWREADSGQAFAAALAERGYVLAQGDRRDFVVIDHAGTTHSLARRLEGVKAAEVRERMAGIDRASLPSVEDARASQREKFRDPATAWAARDSSRPKENVRENVKDKESASPREESSPADWRRGAFTKRLLKPDASDDADRPEPQTATARAIARAVETPDPAEARLAAASSPPTENPTGAPPPREERRDKHSEEFEREDERGLPFEPRHGVRLVGGAIDGIASGIGGMAEAATDLFLDLFGTSEKKPVSDEKQQEQQKGMTPGQAWQKAVETSRAANAEREKTIIHREEQKTHRPLQANERDKALRGGDERDR